MANVAQATFMGGEIIIECNPDWDCCQREQAKAKADGANAEIQRMKSAGCPARVRSTAQLRAAKKDLYGPALEQAREDVTGSDKKGAQTKSRQEQADAAKNNGAPKCLAADIKNGNVNTDDLSMDHTLEVKLGGDAWPGPGQTPLLPLDKKVNGAFGNLMKNTGNKMGAGTEVEGISLVCPPSLPGCPASNPKAKDNSTGNHSGPFPSSPPGGPPRFVTTSI